MLDRGALCALIVILSGSVSYGEQAKTGPRPGATPPREGTVCTGTIAPLVVDKLVSSWRPAFDCKEAAALARKLAKKPMAIWIESEGRKRALKTSLQLTKADLDKIELAGAKQNLMTLTKTGAGRLFFKRVPIAREPRCPQVKAALAEMKITLPAQVNIAVNGQDGVCLICRSPGPYLHIGQPAKKRGNDDETSERQNSRGASRCWASVPGTSQLPTPAGLE